jgi:ABC-type branched-subunit amino acid transport system permease subunit
MKIQASPFSAMLAGAWSGLSLAISDAWPQHMNVGAPAAQDTAFVVYALLFVLVPVYFFVIGHGNAPFGRNWLAIPEERTRYGAIVKRVLVWFLSAGACMAALSLIINLVS